jgi:biopolymer transport protein ExbD
MGFPVSKSHCVRIRKSRRSKIASGKPQLTSLVDVMTVLLIYMIQSFNADGEIITPTKDLQLPFSTAVKKPGQTVTIAVSNKSIQIDNETIASVDQILSNDDMVIPALSAWLADSRSKTEKIEKYSTKTKFKGDITILGDKRIHFRLLKKIMYTCGQEGFNNFKLAVLSKGPS